MRRIVYIILAVLLIALLLAGCGTKHTSENAAEPEEAAEKVGETQEQTEDPSEKPTEKKRWDTPVDLVSFSSLEEFTEYIRSAKEGGDVADLASLEYYFLPAGLPEGYSLYKITAGVQDIGFWYLPDEELSSDETARAAEARGERFLFISPRGTYEGSSISKDTVVIGDKYKYTRSSGLVFWKQNHHGLMMYLPKDFEVSDFDALCETEWYVRDAGSGEFKLVAPRSDSDNELEELISQALSSDGAASELSAYKLADAFDDDAEKLISAIADCSEDDVVKITRLLAYGQTYRDFANFKSRIGQMQDHADGNTAAVLASVQNAIDMIGL